MHKPLSWIKENLIFLPVSGPKMKGKPVGEFILPFQEEIICAALDGHGNPKNNVFMGFSRKISKSMIFSWIFNYFLEQKEGFNLVTMASTFGQSDIIFKLIADQIRLNPNIKESDYKIRREYLENEKRHNNLYKIFSKASSNLGMLNVSAVCADEIGAMQSKENMDAILSGLAMAQTKPCLLFASNPPEKQTHWSNEYLKGLRNDKDWKFFDFSAPIKSDPYGKETKCKANPFYSEYEKTKNPLFQGVYDFINKESESAKQSGENLISYRRFQLGQRVNTAAYQWVDVDDIKIADEEVFKDKNLRPILSFDLSLSRDFCCCVLALFNESTEDIYLYPVMHLANLKDRRPTQAKRFQNWHDQGFIQIQNRDAISKDIFCQDVKNQLDEHKIHYETHVWDRNLSSGWTEQFGGDPVLYRGTAAEMSHAIRFIEARSREGKLHFIGKNPCLLWMFENSICSAKSKGFTLLDRVDSRHSIDGAVCSVMATKFFIEHRRQSFKIFAL